MTTQHKISEPTSAAGPEPRENNPDGTEPRMPERAPKRRGRRRPPDVMGEGHESPQGSDAMGDRLYKPGEPRPPDVMGDGHESPPGSDAMGDQLYKPGEPRPPDVMGDGHESPPGSDPMGNRLYDSDDDAEADGEMG